jgi:hypothetical protein
VLLACGNTSENPNAVVFPADPLTNGEFTAWTGAAWNEVPTGWSVVSPGTAANHITQSPVGSLRIVSDGTYVGLSQTVMTIGNTYAYEVGCSAVASGSVVLSGTANYAVIDSPGVKTGTFVADHASLIIKRGVAGDVTIDYVRITPKNSSQLTDLSGNGRHLVQATAASQPLWVASGAGGVLRFDGTADRLKAAAFALNQPEHVFALIKGANNAANWYAFDGNTAASMALYHASGNAAGNLWAGAGPTSSVAACWGSSWAIADCLFNGAASAIGINGGVPVIGNTGAANAGGFTIGADGSAGGAMWSPIDAAAFIVFNRALPEGERQKVVRFLNRQKLMLGLS